MPLAERLFNGAMNAVAGFAAGVAYLAVSGATASCSCRRMLHGNHGIGPVHGPHATMFAGAARPFAVAALVHVLVNHGLLWGMLLLDRRSRAAAQQGDRTGWRCRCCSPTTSASPRSGLVIAALWPVIGPFAAAIVLVPLYVARWAMGQFAEQQRAHSATLAALCQAVETKDFYTRGHSDRVSRGAGMIARQIGMPPTGPRR